LQRLVGKCQNSTQVQTVDSVLGKYKTNINSKFRNWQTCTPAEPLVGILQRLEWECQISTQVKTIDLVLGKLGITDSSKNQRLSPVSNLHDLR